MLDLIVLHGEFSIFTVRGNFWYQIYRNRRKKVLCSRLSLITLTRVILVLVDRQIKTVDEFNSARVLVGCKPINCISTLSFGVDSQCQSFTAQWLREALLDARRDTVTYRFTTYQDARRVRLVDGLEYLKQIFYEYHPLTR